MVFPPAYHADSDADDEYERSVMTSPHLPTDSETSPTDSEPPSAEHTPTTFGNLEVDRSSPRTLITDWTTEECADFVSSLGLPQYCKHFLENEIVGEALIALKHDELKEMGIASVGHRLTILKSVYDTKVKQDVPVDPDHYIPLSAEASLQDQTATQDDIARIIQSIKLRDERIIAAETELRKITEEYRRLREELLPVFRIAKNQSQPLPYQPPGNSPELHNYDQSNVTLPPISHAPQEKSGSGGLFRKPSKKSFFLGSTPKNNSPTHIPQAIPEGRALSENSNLDPSAAAVAASSHLAASVSGGSQPSNSPNQVNVPSPTSPTAYPNTATLSSRPYVRDAGTSNATRTMYPHVEESLPHFSYSSNATTINGDRDRSNPTPTPTSLRRAQQEDPPGSAGREPHSVEIFKSFRVSLEDPCHKVLPAALKKYNINADWRQYSLYIVYGDQERCLGLDERPLILFKQLDREGRKPMFMLRRHAAPIEGHSGPSVGGPGSAGLDSGMSNGVGLGGRGYQSSIQLPQIQLPGGVL